MTIDEAIKMLKVLRLESRLAGDTVLVVCVRAIPYLGVTRLSLERSDDGVVVRIDVKE